MIELKSYLTRKQIAEGEKRAGDFKPRLPSGSAEMPSIASASPASPTMTPARSFNFKQQLLKAHLLVYKTDANRLNTTRWMQVRGSPSGYKQITREDLRDFDKQARNVLASIDQVLGDLSISDQEV